MPVDGDSFNLETFWNVSCSNFGHYAFWFKETRQAENTIYYRQRFTFDPTQDAIIDNAAMIFSGSERFVKLLALSSESGRTKRAQFSIPFYLYEGLAMSVTAYGAINEQKKKPPTQIEQAEEIREVYYKTVYTQADTGESIDPKRDIVKYASLGTKDQNEQRVSFFSEVSITLRVYTDKWT